MTGLVLVSHSRAVALALKAMIDELFAGKVPVTVAAGAGGGHTVLGTDATAIVAAIEELAAAAESVLVLLDLGSAIPNAERALDLLDANTRARVSLCSAPLVEGAMAAAAQCSKGAPLAGVRIAAESALRQKIEHLQVGNPAPPDVTKPASVPADSADAPEVREMRVDNPHGLHARPSMRIVRAVAPFRSIVHIENLRTGAPAASARSLMAISCLDARAGDTIRVTALGDDAQEVIGALEALHAEQFGELAEAAEDARKTTADRSRKQRPPSPGMMTGERLRHRAGCCKARR